MKGYEIARELGVDASTVSRDIHYLIGQSQNYLGSLATETLPFMYLVISNWSFNGTGTDGENQIPLFCLRAQKFDGSIMIAFSVGFLCLVDCIVRPYYIGNKKRDLTFYLQLPFFHPTLYPS